MKPPLQELYEYMEQNQYFIGNDLLAKYKELIEKEREVRKNAYISGYLDNGYYEGAEEDAAKLWEETYNSSEEP